MNSRSTVLMMAMVILVTQMASRARGAPQAWPPPSPPPPPPPQRYVTPPPPPPPPPAGSFLSPTPTDTPTDSPTDTPTDTPNPPPPSPSPNPSPSPDPSPSPSPNPSPSPDPSPSPSPDPSPSPSPNPSPSPDPPPSPSPASSPTTKSESSRTLIFEDNFTPCEDSSRCIYGGINLENWWLQTGDGSGHRNPLGGWGNNELQCYVNTPDTSRVVPKAGDASDGVLHITTHYVDAGFQCDNSQGPTSTGPSTRHWRSAKLVSAGLRNFTWGGTPEDVTAIEIEVRARVPLAAGTWPAAWMLADTDKYGGWCSSGEIDIMEHVNGESAFSGSIFYGGDADGEDFEKCSSLPHAGTEFDTSNPGDWHTHSVVWHADYLTFKVDGIAWNTIRRGAWWSKRGGGSSYAPFDVPFYINLNMAIGGDFPNSRPPYDVQDKVSSTYEVDWVKVYRLG